MLLFLRSYVKEKSYTYVPALKCENARALVSINVRILRTVTTSVYRLSNILERGEGGCRTVSLARKRERIFGHRPWAGRSRGLAPSAFAGPLARRTPAPWSWFTASGASGPSPTFPGLPRSPPAAASSSFPSPWQCLAFPLRSFFSCRAGCWEVQWAVAAPAAKLGEERGPGQPRKAARVARFCEFCRWGAEEGCRPGEGRG